MDPIRSKVATSNLMPDQAALQNKYGQLPLKKKGLLGGKAGERKYFDSGDYAMSKAGKAVEAVGQQHPSPESIPHQQVAPAQVPPLAGSPTSVGGLPIISNIGKSVGAVGTMANPSGLSPPAVRHIPADASLPVSAAAPLADDRQAAATAAGDKQAAAGLVATDPTAPPARPGLLRRPSQLPTGSQIRYV
ncbi:hypothetical protein GGI10_003884 [Coemansia sp. RSA 2530]|nr:hypothetical protein GGI10_003884 [Coemansia sp. RSA 2530]